MGSAYSQLDLISSERLEGASIYDAKGKKIGKIDQLLIDRISGQVRYAIIDFGGFMGLRHGAHAIPWTTMRYDKERDRYTADVSEQSLEAAPGFKTDSSINREWETQVHRHYNAAPYWEGLGGEWEGRNAEG